jgi:hypothetical protein
LKKVFGGALVVAVLCPAVAEAVEKQHHLGVDAGIAFLVVKKKDSPSVGGGFLAHYAYGITDQWQLALEGGYSIVSLGEQKDIMVTDMTTMMKMTLPNNRPAHLLQGSAGVNYVFDVIRWVPYAGVYATAFGLLGGNLPSPKFVMGATVAAGLDYHITRLFTAGLAVRQHFPFSAMDDYPSFTQVMARAELVWGW